jgi:RHS repeat-associated protein
VEFSDIGTMEVNRSASRSWYSADGKLMVHQVSRDSIRYLITQKMINGKVVIEIDTGYSPGSNWGAYEEYWYDALGRRILKRSRQDAPICQRATRCVSTIERIVWDGDQILWELRDQSLAGPVSPVAGTHTGAIGYIHGGGVDEPLGMIRNGMAMALHKNIRGQYIMARNPSGEEIVTGIIWPGEGWSVQEEFSFLSTDDPKRVRPWYGSLIMGPADRSGLSYRRTRYYSADSGQFTQPDPIGISGGLNVYGYAGGDPVNFSDPFGLDKCPKSASILECVGWMLAPVKTPLEVAGTIATWPLGGGMGMLGGGATRLGLARGAASGLTEDVAATFAGRIHSRILQNDATAYRYSGGASGAVGRYLTTRQTVSRIESASAARSALNLPLGATAENLNSFVIPRGTEIFMGRVAGGAPWATQIWIRNPGVLIP